MSGSSGGATSTTRRGFSQRDVSNFLTSGGQLASQGARKKKITDFKPTEKTQTTDITAPRRTLGIKTTGGSENVTGFGGDFSNMTPAELDEITNVFIQRSKQIQQRRAQGGRSGIFLGGR